VKGRIFCPEVLNRFPDNKIPVIKMSGVLLWSKRINDSIRNIAVKA